MRTLEHFFSPKFHAQAFRPVPPALAISSSLHLRSSTWHCFPSRRESKRTEPWVLGWWGLCLASVLNSHCPENCEKKHPSNLHKIFLLLVSPLHQSWDLGREEILERAKENTQQTVIFCAVRIWLQDMDNLMTIIFFRTDEMEKMSKLPKQDTLLNSHLVNYIHRTTNEKTNITYYILKQKTYFSLT